MIYLMYGLDDNFYHICLVCVCVMAGALEIRGQLLGVGCLLFILWAPENELGASGSGQVSLS